MQSNNTMNSPLDSGSTCSSTTSSPMLKSHRSSSSSSMSFPVLPMWMKKYWNQRTYLWVCSLSLVFCVWRLNGRTQMDEVELTGLPEQHYHHQGEGSDQRNLRTTTTSTTSDTTFTTTDLSSSSSLMSLSSSACTDFREYPKPDHDTGLPYLGDVFATRDLQYIVFVGLNRGICFRDYQKSGGDLFMEAPHRFLCMFPEHTAVISEFVAPTGDDFRNNFLFRCKIPTRFQHLVQTQNSTTTQLHIDLHALHNPEGRAKGMRKWIDFPSVEIATETPKLSQIPICHAGFGWTSTTDKDPYNLVAYTRVQSSYLTQPDKYGQRETRTTTHRIAEWIDYHLSEGFDHFLIYDNDETPHGPIETLTRPYVQAGLVTYRWFPLKDCTIETGVKKGKVKRYGQAAGGLAAMHRLGPKGAHFFAHMDIDEFFVIFDPQTSVLQFTRQMLASQSNNNNNNYDAMEFHPQVLEYCDGTTVTNGTIESVMDKKRCLTKFRYAKQKLIMRMDRMMHYQVHYALATWSWNKPKTFPVNDVLHPQNGGGFLAHFRGELTEGTHESGWNQKEHLLHCFDGFLDARAKKQQTGDTSLGVVVYPNNNNHTVRANATTVAPWQLFSVKPKKKKSK
ncbi:expressed unknown protein [Seminavis robusta]|uniref:Glycosyltransferase family 92 protein n=1 Tax=Seminavis robusta TaxID=568900 RepID=A0A9N8E4F2_9STRA|nr:expressed unknown protein [Seminavis robusta]|eukprot:Sro638_g179630.1 n/a (618) ;mRNA; f:35522-37375